MKEEYKVPSMDVINIEDNDVIATSTCIGYEETKQICTVGDVCMDGCMLADLL